MAFCSTPGGRAFLDDDRSLANGGVGANAYADAVAVYLGFQSTR